jgi:phage N-6-adenine-methyltransferase
VKGGYCRGPVVRYVEGVKPKYTGKTEWYTPEPHLELVRKVFGGKIDVDPASSAQAQGTVQATTWFDKESDGLRQQWYGKVFLNPPYSQPDITRFVEKLVQEYKAGRVAQAIMLTKSATDTEWFRSAWGHCSAFCFTQGRVKFRDPDGETANPQEGHAFFYFGSEVDRFADEFEKIGPVFRLRGVEAALGLIRAMTADELARFDEAYASELRANAKAELRMAS